MHLLVFITVIAAATAQQTNQPGSNAEQFRVLYEWKTIDFEWEAPLDRETYLNSSRYIPRNVLISGVNYYEDKIFLTLPRMLDGVPATLAYIPAYQNETTAPKLKPFPSWNDNMIGNCDALQFVQNIEIDRNGIMWILDNGRVGTLTQNPVTKCPPSIVLIDLKSGENKLERIPLSQDTVNPSTTYLNDLVVDNRDGDYAYITDNSAVDPGIIVFRLKDKTSWKLRDKKSMKSIPEAALFRLNGTTVNLPVNVDGIALGPQYATEDNSVDRIVYYSPLASFNLYAVKASVLQNESLASNGEGALRPFVLDVGTKQSQTDGMKMSSTGVLFYGLIGNSIIAQWNTATNFSTGQRTIARDVNYIQWIDRFTFDDRGNLYVVVNRLFNFVKSQVSVDEVNYRILKSYTGLKSYIFSNDLNDNNSTTPQNAAATKTIATSMVVLAMALIFA